MPVACHFPWPRGSQISKQTLTMPSHWPHSRGMPQACGGRRKYMLLPKGEGKCQRRDNILKSFNSSVSWLDQWFKVCWWRGEKGPQPQCPWAKAWGALSGPVGLGEACITTRRSHANSEKGPGVDGGEQCVRSSKRKLGKDSGVQSPFYHPEFSIFVTRRWDDNSPKATWKALNT